MSKKKIKWYLLDNNLVSWQKVKGPNEKKAKFICEAWAGEKTRPWIENGAIFRKLKGKTEMVYKFPADKKINETPKREPAEIINDVLTPPVIPEPQKPKEPEILKAVTHLIRKEFGYINEQINVRLNKIELDIQNLKKDSAWHYQSIKILQENYETIRDILDSKPGKEPKQIILNIS